MFGKHRGGRLDQVRPAGIGAFACKGLANGGHIVIRVYNKDRAMATAPLRDSHIDPLDGWRLPAWTYSDPASPRSDEHTSKLPSLMRTSYAASSLKKKKQ